MKSIEFWKYIQSNPTGKSLSVTKSNANSDVDATIFEDKIVVDCADLVQKTKVTVETPIDFKVIDVHTIHYDGNATELTIKNGGTAVMSALTILGSDKDIDRAGDIDDAQWAFASGDDDLEICETGDANNLKALVVIHIMPT